MLSLVLVVLAQTSAPEDWIRTPRLERVQRAGGRNGSGLAWFEAFPASGAGLPSAANLCDTLTAAELSGGFCLKGDGSLATGSTVTLSPIGSPANYSTETVCPSGPNCASRSTLRFENVTGATTGQWMFASPPDGGVLPPQSAWTACALFGFRSQAMAGEIFTIANTSGDWDSLWELNGSTVNLYTNGLLRSTIATFTNGARHLLCYTGTAGGVGQAYVDGTATGGAFTSTFGASPKVWTVGGISTGTSGTANYGLNNSFRVDGFTIVVGSAFSSGRIAQIARAVLADAPTGARGEALSETRASVQFCESSDGTGTLLPNNRLCVARGGTTAAQGSFVQSLLRTEELDNASWADVATPTVTANSIVGAGGTLTADTIDDNNAAAFEGRSQSVTVTAAAAYTMSCYAKAGTLAKMRLSLDGTTGDTTTLSSSSWTRVSVTDVSTSGVSVSAQVLAGTATTDTGTIYVWGCNVTPGSSLRPYIPATSAAVTTAAEVPYFTLTNAPALNSIEVTVDTPASYAATARVMSVYKDATNAFDMYVDTTAANKLNCLATVGGVTYSGLSSGAVSASASHRLSCSYDGTSVIACVDGACNSTARSFTMFSAATRVYVGSYATTGAEINPTPVIKAVKADPNGARFR